ncbi:NACHT domain-containing NTPase [Streptomyces sp. XD-27]|uniref:NACHT domain-containing protein n=1 Tax=Streptomyces sp. XD-27 TaxID=3062779 RepID=UPI00350E3EB3
MEQAVAAAGPGERPCHADEDERVAELLAETLLCLGELEMEDVQAVALGPQRLAWELRGSRGPNDHGQGPPNRFYLLTRLSEDAEGLYDRLLETACLHILHFFTQRSTFVARTLVAQSDQLYELITKVDVLIGRLPSQSAEDAGFERRYAKYVTDKYGILSIVGVDLPRAETSWPLDAAYLSLEAIPRAGESEPAAEAAPRPADQALSGHDRVLLRGGAGSGKTTLVQWLAVATAGQRPAPGLEQLIGRVPFVLPLRTIARQESLPTPDRLLAAVRNPLHGAQPPGWADRVLSARRGVLLVDGIDEIPDRDRERTRAWLDDLLIAYPGNLWLVTSRPSAVADDWLAAQGFTEFALSPMGRDEVTAFIGRWHDAVRTTCRDDEERAALDAYEEALLAAVTTKQDLARLATNPLMCGLICALHRSRRGYLPPGRKALYDAALSMLLTRRDTERHVYAPGDPQLDEEPQIQLLQRLAYWLIRNGQAELDREQAERIVADALPNVPAAQALGGAPQVLDHLLLRSGVLREPTAGAVEFVHRTFQDYLGAKAAVEHGDFGLLVNNSHNTQWEDVIRMAVAHARPRERADLLNGLLERGARPGEPASLRLLLLAAACLEHAPDLDPTVRDAVMDRLAFVVPPLGAPAARELAEVGPLALELLPSLVELPDRVTAFTRTDSPFTSEGEAIDYAAEACVIAATHVPTDAAIPYLRQFVRHPFLPVRSQLASSWARFDTQRYYDEVVSRLAPDDLYFAAETEEHARRLLADGCRMLMLRGDFTEDTIQHHLPPGALTHLRLDRNAAVSDLACLDHVQGLRALVLTRCGAVTDLSPLTALSLHSLDWAPPAPRRLPRGLERLTTLEQLRLTLPGTQLPVAPLPRLTWLELDVYHPELDVHAIARCFPRLRHLRVAFRSSPDEGRIDLAPLAALTDLETVSIARADVTGSERLDGIEITLHSKLPRRTGLPA